VERSQGKGTLVRLLECDPDIGEDLDEGAVHAARDAMAVRAESLGWKRCSGQWGPRDPRGFFGFLMLDGLLLRDVRLTRGGSAELLGVGDLLRPWDVDGTEFLPVDTRVGWTALSEVRIAVLDAEFVRRAARWPEVLVRLSARGVLRAKAANLNQAISNFKHLDSRLLMLFWHLADRWGKVGADAITIDLPLTHEVIGRLVGAARPSVTTTLGELSERGLLKRADDAWHLTPSSAEGLQDSLGAAASKGATNS
jgi:CRP/FNR family transcriptional regulator, cyclic AMP receptor protein